jgi:CBS domain containing-hemolysin-like protein
VAEAFEPEAPLVLPAELPANQALRQLVEAHGHCLVVTDGAWVVGLVTLADLQRALSAEAERSETGAALVPSLLACRRGDLVWLPLSAQLAQLEDQLTPNGLRQVPVFDVPASVAAALPHGLPNPGLPVSSLRGLASRDGMARALARHLQPNQDWT